MAKRKTRTSEAATIRKYLDNRFSNIPRGDIEGFLEASRLLLVAAQARQRQADAEDEKGLLFAEGDKKAGKKQFDEEWEAEYEANYAFAEARDLVLDWWESAWEVLTGACGPDQVAEADAAIEAYHHAKNEMLRIIGKAQKGDPLSERLVGYYRVKNV